MESQTLMILVIAVVAVLGIAMWAYLNRQNREKLKQLFGPEYERTVEETGDPAKADDILRKRVARVDRFKLRPLNRQQADAFTEQWRRVQARFVDDPDAAVSEADNLVTQVMTARGYPLEDFERRAEDVSVDHPRVVENYRTAKGLIERRARGDAGTEELRQAVVNYRALFDDLLDVEDRQRRRAS